MEKRKAIRQKDREIYNNKIFYNIMDYFGVKSYNNIMLYFAYQSEASVNQLIDYYLNKEKAVALPKCINKNGKMIALYISNMNQVQKGMYGIDEPILERCRPCNVTDLDVVFVPGIAFATNGTRIGYGKGYYDFFLKRRNPNTILIGVAYDVQICSKCDMIIESHDVKMNYVVTEKQIYQCEEG